MADAFAHLKQQLTRPLHLLRVLLQVGEHVGQQGVQVWNLQGKRTLTPPKTLTHPTDENEEYLFFGFERLYTFCFKCQTEHHRFSKKLKNSKIIFFTRTLLHCSLYLQIY